MSVEKSVCLRLLPQNALEAMLADDLVSASRMMRLDVPALFLREKWLWEVRLNQVRQSPPDAPWLVRVAVLQPDGVVIGHAGYHGRPGPSGTVEIGYTIVPGHRGKGYSHLVLSALVEEAVSTNQVATVRATISPDNLASLAVVTAAQFRHVGEQWDSIDGTELIFETHLEQAVP